MKEYSLGNAEPRKSVTCWLGDWDCVFALLQGSLSEESL